MFDTALNEGEIITEVKFPVPEMSNYQKFVQPASRFALVGVFVAKYADGVRVAVTGASEATAGPPPKRRSAPTSPLTLLPSSTPQAAMA